jgi:hypothetical protein
MAIQFSNLASTTLASGVSSSATSVSVTSASSFPSLGSGDYFYATIGAGSGSEIVKVTAISGTTFTVVRGEDGTTAVSHASGADCALRVTAGTLEDLRDGGQVYTAGSGLGLSGNEFTNTAPDQTVSLTGAGTTSVSGTYPNFTITGAGTTYTAGSGLSLNGTEFANTAPDQTVALTGAGATSISGTYPNFTITSTDTVYTLPAGYATETYVGTAISNLVDSSPAALNTLNELAAALGDDPNFATTVSTSIGTKLPLAGGTLTGALSGTTATFSGVVTINTTSSTALNVDSSANSLLVPIGGSAQTAYTDVQLITDGGNGEIFKSGTLYSDWGGSKAFNFYNSDGVIAFHPSATANVLQITSTVVNSTKPIQISGTTVIDASRNITAGNLTPSGYISQGTGQSHYFRGASDANWRIGSDITADTGGLVDSAAIQMIVGGGSSPNYGFQIFGHTTPTVPVFEVLPQANAASSITNIRGKLYINNTEVIDNSRNLTNIGNLNTSGSGNYVLIGGSASNNAYNTVPATTGLMFGGGNDANNYSIGTSSQNIGGNYTKLNIKWHTGIRFFSMPVYGGTRFYSDAAMSTETFSINNLDGHVRAANNLYANGGNLVWNASNDGSGSGLDADLLDGQQGSYYAPITSLGDYLHKNANTMTGSSFKMGFHSGAGGTTFGANHYSMGVDIANGGWSGTNYSDLIIGYHTGIRIGAGYSGIRFYNNSPTTDTNNTGNGNGAESLLMTIGGGGSSTSGANVTVNNGLTVGGVIDANGGHGAINITNSSILSSATSSWTGDPGGAGKIQYHSNRWYIVGDSSSNRIVQFRRNNSDKSYIDNNGALIGGGNWYSGNDGSGSGLDADLLDGQQGSYYAPASHNHSGVYTPYDHFRHTGNGNYTSTTTSALLTQVLGYDAFDSKLTAHKTSWSYAGNGDLTDAGRLTELAGTSWLWWTDNSAANVQGNITGLAIAPNTGGSAGKMFVYNNQGSDYSPGWREIWTSTSDGSGSGLDADLLDGIDSTYFNRGDNVYGVMVGINGWNMNDLFTTRNRAGFFDVWNGSNFPPSTTHVHGMQVRHNSSAHYGWQLAGQYGQNSLWHRQVSNNSWGAWNQQWSSGNDGSGSGLDADLFDGRDSAHYVFGTTGKGTTNLSFASLTNASSGFYDVYNSGTPTGTWYSLVNMHHHSVNHGHQIAGSFYDAGEIYNRNNNNTSLSAWAKIWNTANDGSGSGLDADTVDGIQGASLLRSDADDSFTGALISTSRHNGIFGIYDSTKTDHIWSMGTSYKNHSAGANFGNLYGLAYKHTNNGTGGNLADGHMMVWCQNGNPTSAMGTNIWTSGSVKAASFLYNSDRAFKTNIKPIKNALSTVLSLSGVSYTLKKSGKNTTGFIAQEVEKVLPDMVDGDEGEKGVNYGQMVALLTEAMREQQNLIVSLQKEIQELKDATK